MPGKGVGMNRYLKLALAAAGAVIALWLAVKVQAQEPPPQLPCRIVGQYVIDIDIPSDISPVLMVQVVDPETKAVIAHTFTQSANLGEWIRLDIYGTQQITLQDALAILRMQAGVK